MSDTPRTDELLGGLAPTDQRYWQCLDHARDLERENAALRKECDKWKTQWQTTEDERASSFARLAKAVGGCSLTEYQPEIDLELEAAIKALRADEARLEFLFDLEVSVTDKKRTRGRYHFNCRSDVDGKMDAALAGKEART